MYPFCTHLYTGLEPEKKVLYLPNQFKKFCSMEKALFSEVYNRKGKLLTDGTALIQVRAYLNGISKYYSTSVYIKPDQWDGKHKRIKNHPNAIRLNKEIADYIAKMETIELNRRNAKKPFTLEILHECMNGKQTDSFTEFMKREIEADRNNAPATKVTQTTTLNVMSEFRKNILFEELSFELMTDLERFFLNKGLGVNTVHKYFRHIRKFVNLAIDNELFDLNRYPFRKFKPKSEETHRDYLTPEQLTEIEKLKFSKENDYLQAAKDIFLFSCYCGLRFSDISELKPEDIKIIDGKKWIDTIMIKTGEALRVPLFALFDGKPTQILESYLAYNRKYIFDNHTNQHINRCLKEIATLAKIESRLTFHTARHFNATFLLYKGVPVTTVQKLLGHKKLQTTMIYAKVMDRTLVNELEAVTFTAPKEKPPKKKAAKTL